MMLEALPYFAGFITLLMGAGFYWGLQEIKEYGSRYRKPNDE